MIQFVSPSSRFIGVALPWSGKVAFCYSKIRRYLNSVRCETQKDFGVQMSHLLKCTFVCVAISILVGCQGTQLKTTTLDLASIIERTQREQIINNFGRIMADNQTLPSQVLLSTGLVQINNTVLSGVTFPLSSMFSRTAAASVSSVTTTAGGGASLGANVTWQEQFSVAPVTDPFTLRNLKVLYRTIIFGFESKGRPDKRFETKNQEILSYQVPRFYNKLGQLVPEHYYFESASCVFCASSQYIKEISEKNLEYPSSAEDIQMKIDQGKILLNDIFKYQWIFYRKTNSQSEAFQPFNVPESNLIYTGNYGGFDIFISKTVYDKNGVVAGENQAQITGGRLLSDFMLITLPPGIIPPRPVVAVQDKATANAQRGTSPSASLVPQSLVGPPEGSKQNEIFINPPRVLPQ